MESVERRARSAQLTLTSGDDKREIVIEITMEYVSPMEDSDFLFEEIIDSIKRTALVDGWR